MGQCVSRKAAGAFAASAAAAHNRPSAMHKHRKLQESPDDEDDRPRRPDPKKPPRPTKGVAMSFGFRRHQQQRPATAPGDAAVGRRLAGDNGNGGEGEASCGRTTPRLVPPRKEASATTRVSRFGFRQQAGGRYTKVSDITSPPPTHTEFSNNNNFDHVGNKILHSNLKQPATTDTNKNKPAKSNFTTQPPQIGRFTLHSSQLPKPQVPERVIETKTQKTLANTNRKILANLQRGTDTDTSSKEGSEDSGVGSHISGGQYETQGLVQMESSPLVRRKLEVVLTGNTFDVRDLEENVAVDNVALPPLPNTLHNTGIVKERKLDYQWNLNRRKISATSSEGFSDEFAEDNRYHNEKNAVKSFLKAKPVSPFGSSSEDWTAGEAMADDVSCSFSSTERSIGDVIHNLAQASIAKPKPEGRMVLLSIEDPKFAAVAAASNTSSLLQDETSPTDSLIGSCSESDDPQKKPNKSSTSSSKEINENPSLTPPSPGTPTHASNSLSLSEGKDFFVDDEIADQPALVFDDTLTNDNNTYSVQQGSEGNSTLVDSTPKLRRRSTSGVKESPLPLRRKFLVHRSGSVDTLSPCESIASDDMMMDFEYSQSSGLDDLGDNSVRNKGNESCEDCSSKFMMEIRKNDPLRDWPSMTASPKSSPRSTMRTSRLLRSRNSTPTVSSSAPDSPRSLDGRSMRASRPSLAGSPLRMAAVRTSSSAGYESDDSARFERPNHLAMAQDVMSIKTMLLKLKRVLHETDEEVLLRSETHNPFENQPGLKNGFFNGLNSHAPPSTVDEPDNARLELADLRRQVLFLQGQLEDRERTVQNLQEQMVRYVSANEGARSAPASTIAEAVTCNAATQTERVRPVSAGPSLFQSTSQDESVGSLVSVNEAPPRRLSGDSRKAPSRLWRRPGEPPSPQRYTNCASSIPRRANSRTRAPSTPS